MNHVRNLADDQWDNTDADSVASEDSMDVQFEGEVPKFRKPGKYYRNQVNSSNHTGNKYKELHTVESFIFVGLKFRGFQIGDKLVGI